jgi:hypothetical protein
MHEYMFAVYSLLIEKVSMPYLAPPVHGPFSRSTMSPENIDVPTLYLVLYQATCHLKLSILILDFQELDRYRCIYCLKD